MTDEATPTPAPEPAAPAPEPAAPSPLAAETSAEPNPTDAFYAPEPTEKVEPSAEPAPVEPKTEDAPVEANPALAAYEGLTLPDGLEVVPETLTAFKELAAKAGLDATAAQELLTLGATQQLSAAQAVQAQADALWNTTLEGWKAELAADPLIGGAKSQEAYRTIGRALDEFGSAEARAAFDATGAGWNPAIVRFVHKMASALNEGRPVQARGPVGQRQSMAHTFYPTTEQ